jgi:hypothetical protein
VTDQEPEGHGWMTDRLPAVEPEERDDGVPVLGLQVPYLLHPVGRKPHDPDHATFLATVFTERCRTIMTRLQVRGNPARRLEEVNPGRQRGPG